MSADEPQADRDKKRSWLPRNRAEPLPADAPSWVPPGFAAEEIAWARLSYIVVDELSPDVAGLVIVDWPRLDHRGRVRFPGEAWRVGASVTELNAFLAAQRRLPSQTRELDRVRERPVRIGDAFAAPIERPRGLRTAVPALERWLRTPIYDVSADAREAAKTALYGALAPVMSDEEAAEIAAEALDVAQ
jgi:hypothetical protein